MIGRLYRNKKTQQYYRIENIAVDCTNDRDGRSVIVYIRDGTYSPVFVRDLEEFKEKFEEVNDRLQD